MVVRYIFATLVTVLFTCVLVQIFIAGLAIFDHPLYWGTHTAFVHIFEFLPLLMLLVGWLGKSPRKFLWQSAGLFGLIFFQYFTANIREIFPPVAATHLLVALAAAALAYAITVGSWKFTRAGRI